MISGIVAFHMYDTHGIPIEVTEFGVSEGVRKSLKGIGRVYYFPRTNEIKYTPKGWKLKRNYLRGQDVKKDN